MKSMVCVSLLVVALCLTLCSAYPSRTRRNYRLIPYGDLQGAETNVYARPASTGQDLEGAASEHGHYGRVQIKVYRGPTTHHGHEHFAPHGFWVKQPADDEHH